MSEIKRNWDLLSDEKRKIIIDEIIYFFDTERNEKIGIIAAEQILDQFLQTIGLELYNKGIEDSTLFLKDRFDNSILDIESLLKK